VSTSLEDRHARDPQPGDYWQEMFCPVCVVVSRDGDSVLVCRTVRWLPDERWTWDLGQLACMSVEEFQRWLSYKTHPGYWARVLPGRMPWVAATTAWYDAPLILAALRVAAETGDVQRAVAVLKESPP